MIQNISFVFQTSLDQLSVCFNVFKDILPVNVTQNKRDDDHLNQPSKIHAYSFLPL